MGSGHSVLDRVGIWFRSHVESPEDSEDGVSCNDVAPFFISSIMGPLAFIYMCLSLTLPRFAWQPGILFSKKYAY